MQTLQDKNPSGQDFMNGLGTKHPLFDFIWDNCKTGYLKDKHLFTANITLCGYDYFALAEIEMDAKLDLCNMLMKSKYIAENFRSRQTVIQKNNQ